MNITPVQFTCDMCGEMHDKVLPISTQITACRRCGNLIDISSLQRRNRISRRLNHNEIDENFFENGEDDPYCIHQNNYDSLGGDNLDDDFYDFNRNDDDEDRYPRFNINNNVNNRRSRENRPFVRVNGNNRSSSMGGMFAIQIPNDNYDRVSAFHHRSNFGYPSNGNNNRNRNRNRNRNNNINIYREINNIMDNFDYNFGFGEEDNSINSNEDLDLGIFASLLKQETKPKIKLKKIKMCKDLYTTNDNGKSEKPTCCICLGIMKLNDEVTLLKCQHLFHFKCLDKWVETKEACPFCRGKIEFGKIVKKTKKEDAKIEDKKIEDKKIEDKKKEDKKVLPIIGKTKSKNNISLFKTKYNKTKK